MRKKEPTNGAKETPSTPPKTTIEVLHVPEDFQRHTESEQEEEWMDKAYELPPLSEEDSLHLITSPSLTEEQSYTSDEGRSSRPSEAAQAHSGVPRFDHSNFPSSEMLETLRSVNDTITEEVYQSGRFNNLEDLPYKAGDWIATRYQILGFLSRGGLSHVFCAFDTLLQQEVAIKVFAPDVGVNLSLRIEKELQTCKQISHPNVVSLYEMGYQNQRYFLVLELLIGQDLEALLQQQVLTMAQKIDILIQVCYGLHATHQKNIIHRDLKPSNLFITTNGLVKIMDFGIALDCKDKARLTKAGTVIGTANYMPPERVNSQAGLTSASDFYSLGVVAFEMLTGSLPFVHSSFTKVLMMHTTQPPPTLRSINPHIPVELEAIVLQLLSKDPNHRQQSVQELVAQLQSVKQYLPLH